MRVDLDGRVFIVELFLDGSPRVIKERKLYAPGTPRESFYLAPYWHHAHHAIGGEKTIVRRILNKAAGA